MCTCSSHLWEGIQNNCPSRRKLKKLFKINIEKSTNDSLATKEGHGWMDERANLSLSKNERQTRKTVCVEKKHHKLQ